MSIIIKEIDKSELKLYATLPMYVEVKSIYNLVNVSSGFEGILFKEEKVKPYIKDLGVYSNPMDWEFDFDTSNWRFFLAYLDNLLVGAATLVFKTEGLDLLDNREDLAVLWDIRVKPEYQKRKIGSRLFQEIVKISKDYDLKQLKIETQNNNVAACKFYKNKGCQLGEINKYAYFLDDEDEIKLVWYLDL